MTTTPATSALAEALRTTHVGRDSQPPELDTPERCAAAILTALPDHILVKRADWERLTRIVRDYRELAEWRHNRSHLTQEVTGDAITFDNCGRAFCRDARAALAPQPDAAQEPKPLSDPTRDRLAALLVEAQQGGYVCEIPETVVADRLIAAGVRLDPAPDVKALRAAVKAMVRYAVIGGAMHSALSGEWLWRADVLDVLAAPDALPSHGPCIPLDSVPLVRDLTARAKKVEAALAMLKSMRSVAMMVEEADGLHRPHDFIDRDALLARIAAPSGDEEARRGR